MFKMAKVFAASIHHDQGGSYFVEMALVLIGVALSVFLAASGLATNGIVPKYEDITNWIDSVDVPEPTP